MERFQVEAAATALHIPIMESQCRFNMWVKNNMKSEGTPHPSPRHGTQGTSCLRSARIALKKLQSKDDPAGSTVVGPKPMAPEAVSVSNPGGFVIHCPCNR